MTSNKLFCKDCRVKLSCEQAYNDHIAGKKHRSKLFEKVKTNPDLVKDKHGVEIALTCERADIREDRGHDVSILMDSNMCLVEFDVGNTSEDVVKLLAVDQFSNNTGVTFRKIFKDHVVQPGETVEVEMDVQSKFLGKTLIPVLFTFVKESTGEEFCILRQVHYECVRHSDLYQILKPITPYQKMKTTEAYRDDVEIIRSDYTSGNLGKLVYPLPLGTYPMPLELKRAYFAALKNPWSRKEFGRRFNLEKLSFSNYSDHFNNLIHVERREILADLQKYTMTGAFLVKELRTVLFKLEVSGLTEQRPSVMKGDSVYVKHRDDESLKRAFQGIVVRVERDKLVLRFNKRFHEEYPGNNVGPVKVEFGMNLLPYKLAHRAVTMAGKNPDIQFERLLFPVLSTFEPIINPKELQLSYYGKQVLNNEEQKAAVINIVCGSSRPAPYLIYGPPGTGKTTTVVEAIKQVYTVFYKKCRILVCAPQNGAADILTERLIDNCVSKQDIMRLHAFSRSYNDLSDKVKTVSNFKKSGSNGYRNRKEYEAFLPSKDYLEEKRILVMTLVSAGRLVSAEMTDHFTHIFIDEAGQATEPETLIPLVGLLNIPRGGQVVLAGDPNQLGPIIMSNLAKQFKLDQSLLERLMLNSAPYQRKRKGYNRTFLTKLVNSFRSHPAILDIPNRCFYDNELRVCTSQAEREKYCKWEGLPKQGFPLIFHGVYGKEEREAKSPSWFNRHEVLQVIEYVEQLLTSRFISVDSSKIGIISPYHQQVMKIKKALEHLDAGTTGKRMNYSGITVGSVEKFQGDEREVIIISTVRSREVVKGNIMEFLGFLSNKKRFNVAITRAKALLIVVGNPAVLKHDESWVKLISYIKSNGGYKGEPFVPKSK